MLLLHYSINVIFHKQDTCGVLAHFLSFELLLPSAGSDSYHRMCVRAGTVHELSCWNKYAVHDLYTVPINLNTVSFPVGLTCARIVVCIVC